MATVGPINYGYFNYSQGNYTQRIDYDSSDNPIYIGWAQAGTATSVAQWRIIKNTYSVVNSNPVFVSSGFAGGSPSFSFIWDNRASLTYA